MVRAVLFDVGGAEGARRDRPHVWGPRLSIENACADVRGWLESELDR
jgi:hypothetical protein